MMEADKEFWSRLGTEFDEGLRRELTGGRTRGTERKSLAVRTRGASRASERRPAASRRAPVIIVEVEEGRNPPAEREIRSRLDLRGAADIYYSISGRHWASLAERELNPSDPERGQTDHLFLRNLVADYAIVVSKESPPQWSRTAGKIIQW